MVYQEKFIGIIKTNGKVLREMDDGVVYLPFSSEYEIQLKNLNSRKAQVKISIDGQDVLYNKALIINPNETQTLTRFVKDLDKGNKFKFVRKTQQISDYRGDRIDDGIIQIIYTFEKQKPITITTNHYHNNWWYPNYQPYWSWPQIIYTNSTGLVGGRGSSCSNFSADSNPNMNDAPVVMACCSEPKDFSKPLVDEGITVGGSQSFQKFNYGSINELEENSHVIIIRLKGYHNDKQVEKPLMVKESLVCDICGTKNRSNHKCCSECGTALEF
jgi:hypothetical protein